MSIDFMFSSNTECDVVSLKHYFKLQQNIALPFLLFLSCHVITCHDIKARDVTSATEVII